MRFELTIPIFILLLLSLESKREKEKKELLRINDSLQMELRITTEANDKMKEELFEIYNGKKPYWKSNLNGLLSSSLFSSLHRIVRDTNKRGIYARSKWPKSKLQ